MITIILDNKGDIYPGQTLKGNIELVPDSQIYINDIELSLFYIEEWNYTKSEKKTDKGNYKQCISIKELGVNKFLPEGDNNLIRLDPILHLFPFEIKLPNFLYPSFEYPKHNCIAYLRYTLLAKLVAPNTELATSKLIFIYSPSKRDNSNFEVENNFNVKKWGMFGKGSTKIKASLIMKCFRFSEKIPISIDIDNTNGKMKVTLVKINLVRKMALKDNNNDFKVKYSYNDKVMKKVYKVEVKSGRKEVYDFKFPLNEIPLKEFSFFDNVNLFNWDKSHSEFIPSIESNLLSCQYLLKITLYFDSFLKKGDRPRIILPIFLVHKIENNNNDIPKNQNTINIANKGAIEASEEEIKKQKENDFVIIDNNSNNQQMFAKPMSAHNDFDRAKTINNNNSYIDNMANKYKDNNQNPNYIVETPMSSYKKPNNDNDNNKNFQDNKVKENNNNFNSRAKTVIENNNNIINDNNIENQDQDEAPSIQFYNNIQNKDINIDPNNKK